MGTETEFVTKAVKRWKHKLLYVTVGSFAGAMDTGLGSLVIQPGLGVALKLVLAAAVVCAVRRACGFLSVNPVPPIEPGEEAGGGGKD
jgi:hypothetical protein